MILTQPERDALDDTQVMLRVVAAGAIRVRDYVSYVRRTGVTDPDALAALLAQVRSAAEVLQAVAVNVETFAQKTTEARQ